MFSDRVFLVTFIISFIAHGVILMQNPDFHLPQIIKKEKPVEVSYVKPARERRQIISRESEREEPLPLPPPTKISAKKIAPPPFIEKEELPREERESLFKRPVFTKPSFMKSDVISVKKIITLPPVEIDKINNPTYINYYQIVREKIRRAAYQNYSRTDTGEVFLSFVILRDGSLTDARLIEEKSAPNAYLREIASKSIQQAAPFPVFPAELDYPQLSFNVVISFEIE